MPTSWSARIKKAFADAYGEIDDAAVKKITGSVDQVQNLIRSFRNDANPKIAVTVDLLTTGIDVPTITNLVFLRRVNSRILYEQMIGRATRLCPEIGKEVFRIFDAVDLYPHLQNLTEMKPVVVNPVDQLRAACSTSWSRRPRTRQRETIREQLVVKLRRRLKKLPEEARAAVRGGRRRDAGGDAASGCCEDQPADAAPMAVVAIRPSAPSSTGSRTATTPRFMPISHHADEVVAVTRGYGEAEKPEDFLDGFTAFVRDNVNTIAALKLVVQRPRDLTRADLKELRLALDLQGLFRGQPAPRLGGCEERGHCRLDHRLRPSGGARRSAGALCGAGEGGDAARSGEPARGPSRRSAGCSGLASRSKRKSSSTARRSTASRSSPMAASRGSTRCLTESLRAFWPGSTKKCGRRQADDHHHRYRRQALGPLPRPARRRRHLQRVRDRADLPAVPEDAGGDEARGAAAEGYRWGELAKREGLEQLDYYKRLLLDLGKPEIKDGLVRAIFTDAQTRLRKPTNLKALTSSIDQLDWFSAREEGLGNLYEGLLEKNAADKKSGAGQYFTPRPLIDCIVRLMKPQPGEIVQDPAAGTAGFLVAADRYIKDHTDDLYKLPEAAGLLPAAQRLRRRRAGARHASALHDEPAAARHRGRRRIASTRCRRTARRCRRPTSS